MCLPFAHNDVYAFHAAIPCSATKLLFSESKSTVTLEIIHEFFPADNVNSYINEAHATGLYVLVVAGVALLELVDCVLAQMPTLGKAPARSGGA
jgi:7-keto-8-aminopelargonate synthetase-like enzyme